MNDDLVKRLRFPLSQLDGGPNDEELWDRIYTDREEAADRIEALEAALREINRGPYLYDLSGPQNYELLQRVARAALAGEKKNG